MILVFNKIDAFTYTPKDPDDLTPATRENISLDEFKEKDDGWARWATTVCSSQPKKR